MQTWIKGLMAAAISLALMATVQVLADQEETKASYAGQHHGKYLEVRRPNEHAEGKMQGLRATNAAWKAECSACHLAYPPGLLPASSWQAMMGNLDKHFGTDASLDEATVKEILPFLTTNAAPEPRKPRAEPILRITETAWFKHEHDEISALTWKNPKIKSAANCAACHTQAEQGNFDEDTVRIPR